MKYPRWLPLPASIAVAVGAGFILGAIESLRDERRARRRESEVWDKATVSESVGSNGSGPTGTDTGNRASSDSDIPLP